MHFFASPRCTKKGHNSVIIKSKLNRLIVLLLCTLPDWALHFYKLSLRKLELEQNSAHYCNKMNLWFKKIFQVLRNIEQTMLRDWLTDGQTDITELYRCLLGEYDDLLTLVKMVWPCLKVFWLSKDNPTRHRDRKRRGRQKKRWKDNIKEWTEKYFVSSTRAAENRTWWERIVVTSSVVPQQPSTVKEKNRI